MKDKEQVDAMVFVTPNKPSKVELYYNNYISCHNFLNIFPFELLTWWQ
jgi:hypothetical protein